MVLRGEYRRYWSQTTPSRIGNGRVPSVEPAAQGERHQAETTTGADSTTTTGSAVPWRRSAAGRLGGDGRSAPTVVGLRSRPGAFLPQYGGTHPRR